MKLFHEHTCHKCGVIAEMNFNFAGPHIKSICSSCGFYIKFIDAKLIPDIKTLKIRILSLANNNLQIIEAKKKELGLFYEGIDGLNAKIAYWKLYIHLLYPNLNLI
jgi:hypothetical protein